MINVPYFNVDLSDEFFVKVSGNDGTPRGSLPRVEQRDPMRWYSSNGGSDQYHNQQTYANMRVSTVDEFYNYKKLRLFFCGR